ncbi:MAG: hypothetical protein ABIK09_03680 [Pseudomonadota bacterium]
MTTRRDILSVDVEALIRKRAAHTFRSPHHYPVELVRDAARRGARSVSIRISGARIEVTDDGASRAAEDLRAMALLLDPAAPVADRLSAMDRFEALRGLGLLAALAPAPSRLRVEGVEGDPGALEVRPGGRPVLERSAGGRNRVLIERRGQPAEERSVLRDWCRWARLRISLDDEVIGGGDPSPHLGLAQLPGEAGEGAGLLWLPVRGEACRVRLLDHGIQWRFAAYGPDHGLLYEAAVESPEVPPGQLRTRLRALALELYLRAMETRGSLPEDARDRLDEMVFLHHRRTDSRHLMGSYAPFRVAGTERLIDLDAIRDRAASGAVAALPESANIERYAVEGEAALVLTPRQWEYLEEYAGVPLVPPPLRPRRRGLLWRTLGDLGCALRGGSRRAAERPSTNDPARGHGQRRRSPGGRPHRGAPDGAIPSPRPRRGAGDPSGPRPGRGMATRSSGRARPRPAGGLASGQPRPAARSAGGRARPGAALPGATAAVQWT